MSTPGRRDDRADDAVAAVAGASRRLKTFVAVLLALFALIVGVVAFLAGHAATDSLQSQANGACDRLNVLRAEDNVSHLADYRVFRIVLVESQKIPTRKDATQIERRYQRLFLAQLADAVRAKEWTPLTDCKQAVEHSGVRYRTPQPIPFYRQLPPARALQAPDHH